jgi:hypothetical protein
MAKGSRLLRVLVHPSLETLESIQALRDKGHTVMSSIGPLPLEGSEVWTFDLILGPNCWRMDTILAKHVDLAVKSSRLEKYGPQSSRKVKSDEKVPE